MGIDLPSPLLPKLLSGLLGNGPHGLHGNGLANGLGNAVGEATDHEHDNNARQSREAALQNERVVEAGNEQGRWQHSEGPNSNNGNNGLHRGHEGSGAQGPGNSHGADNGHLPTPGDVLSNVLGKADAAARGLFGQNGNAGPLGQNGPPGLLGKAGDVAGNALNQVGQQVGQAANAAGGLAAKSLESMPLANAANAASSLLTQAATQALNAPGAQALAARNAMHDAASGPVLPGRDVAAPLQTPASHALAGSTMVPGASRAADAALLQGRQDLPLPMRAEQAFADRAGRVLPGSHPPPAAAPTAVDATRALPVAAPPSTVVPSQSAAAMEGRTNLVGGNDRVGQVPKAADMAQQTPPGHTGAAPARIGRRDGEAGESLAQRLLQAMAALMGLGPAKAVPAEDEDTLAQLAADDRWQRLQWVFWSLAVAGYACLVFALIVFIPGGSGILHETRNPFGTPVLIIGLVCSLGAWWLARKLAANAEPEPKRDRHHE